MITAIQNALVGGVLIGVAVTLMLWLNGRTTGVSGILNNVLTSRQKDSAWRWAFIGGLVLGGAILYQIHPSSFANSSGRSLTEISVAGFLVGFGTIMGGGCTSGHGICGISRFSMRSLVATVTFILSGILIVALLKNVFAEA